MAGQGRTGQDRTGQGQGPGPEQDRTARTDGIGQLELGSGRGGRGTDSPVRRRWAPRPPVRRSITTVRWCQQRHQMSSVSSAAPTGVLDGRRATLDRGTGPDGRLSIPGPRTTSLSRQRDPAIHTAGHLDYSLACPRDAILTETRTCRFPPHHTTRSLWIVPISAAIGAPGADRWRSRGRRNGRSAPNGPLLRSCTSALLHEASQGLTMRLSHRAKLDRRSHIRGIRPNQLTGAPTADRTRRKTHGPTAAVFSAESVSPMHGGCLNYKARVLNCMSLRNRSRFGH